MGLQTALHRAAAVGNRDAISALIHGGCALDLQDKQSNTALHEVSWHGFSPCVKLLVKAGADVHVKNKAGNTALHLACQNGHCQTARKLLLGGAVPDNKNNAGDTCLHIAARYNHSAVIKILLSSSRSVAEKNKARETALHVAAGLNHMTTVSLLLEAGADAYIKNNSGHTALDKARDNNNRDLAILLAKSNQVRKFARGKTVKKRRNLLQTQSIPRDQIPLEKLQTSEKNVTEVGEDAKSSDHLLHKIQPEQNKASWSPKLKISRQKKDYYLQETDSSSWKKYIGPRSHKKEPPQEKTFQLYTLYRDKDGEIKQAPVKDCHCKPIIRKLENKLKGTEMEMRSHIQKMNSRLDKIEHKHKHQIKVLDKLTQERVSAERMECHYRIKRRATLERMDGEKGQVAATNEVKSWRMSKIQDLEVRTPETRHYKLLRSSSVVDKDPEGLPLLSFISKDNSSSLATYVNVLPSPGAGQCSSGKILKFEDTLGRRYLDGFSDDYHHLKHLFQSKHKPLLKNLGTADPQWQRIKQQEANISTSRPYKEIQCCDSSASSSLSKSSKKCTDSDTDTVLGSAWKHGKHLKDRIKAHCVQQDGAVSTLEVFAQEPVETTFIQERANLHAVEVTQHFFETVSTQLERWYERKIEEAQRVVEEKALQDRVNLLQKINTLEEELQKLRANTET